MVYAELYNENRKNRLKNPESLPRGYTGEMNMNLNDIDFGAIGNLLNSLSDEDKKNMTEMAQNMMKGMNQNTFDQSSWQEEEQEMEEEADENFYQALLIDPEEYRVLSENILSQIEAGYDLESFYEDITDPDLSASVVFYDKALLNALREKLIPFLREEIRMENTPVAAATTLQTYIDLLSNEELIKKITGAGYGTRENWESRKQMLEKAGLLLQKAEFDQISRTELEELKKILFEQDLMLHLIPEKNV